MLDIAEERAGDERQRYPAVWHPYKGSVQGMAARTGFNPRVLALRGGRVLLAMLAQSHLLVEGVPEFAKTLTVHAALSPGFRCGST